MCATLTNRLIPPISIEVPVPSQESYRSYICVLGDINFASFNVILILDFGTGTAAINSMLKLK